MYAIDQVFFKAFIFFTFSFLMFFFVFNSFLIIIPVNPNWYRIVILNFCFYFFNFFKYFFSRRSCVPPFMEYKNNIFGFQFLSFFICLVCFFSVSLNFNFLKVFWLFLMCPHSCSILLNIFWKPSFFFFPFSIFLEFSSLHLSCVSPLI